MDFGPYSITQLLQICRQHIHDANNLISQRCSIGLRSGDCEGQYMTVNSVMFKKTFCNDLSFVTLSCRL